MTFSPIRRAATVVCLAAILSLAAQGAAPGVPTVAAPAPGPGAQRINLDSIVRMTFQNNLGIAIERLDLESSKLSFERFIRNQSSFTPFILDSSVERELESEIDKGVRRSERSYSGGVSVGMEKEFFDGTNIEAETGVSANQDENGRRTANPFVEVGVSMPLKGSITRLERTIERTFEETELFRAWLGFIGEVREAIRESLGQYVFLQQSLAERRRIEEVLEEYRQLERRPELAGRANVLAQIRNRIQDYQSDLAGLTGQIENNRISLVDNIGLDALDMGQLDPLEINPANLYGTEYLTRTIQSLIDEAFENDIEIQVLRIQRSNAELELELAQKGKWDITGRFTGGYDFPTRGDDPSKRSGYQLGLGVSIRRNDPKLLDLSVRQSRAEIGKLDAQIAQQNRSLTSEIRQNLVQGESTRRVIQELVVSVQSRKAVYQQKLTDFLAGNETVENFIQARDQVFEAEEELLEEIFEFYDIALDLDEASGRFFTRLGDLMPQFNMAEIGAGGSGR